MGSITFAIDNEIKEKIKKFAWINWSEVGREELERRFKLEEIKKQLETKEEKDFIEWSVELGKKAKRGRFERLFEKLKRKNHNEINH